MRAKVITVVVTLFGWLLIGGYIYLWLNGWSHPIARLLGVYEHRVTQLEEYCAYLKGADLYRRHDAHVLSFDLEALRDQYAEYSNVYMRQDPLALGAFESIDRRQLGAWRSGETLHLASDGFSDRDPAAQQTFSFWVALLRADLARRPSRDDKFYCHSEPRRRLFSQISLHGVFPDEVATLATRPAQGQP